MIHKLTPAELLALAAFIHITGGRWRQILRHAWESNGVYPLNADIPTLTKLKERLGSQVLNLSTFDIQEAATKTWAHTKEAS